MTDVDANDEPILDSVSTLLLPSDHPDVGTLRHTNNRLMFGS